MTLLSLFLLTCSATGTRNQLHLCGAVTGTQQPLPGEGGKIKSIQGSGGLGRHLYVSVCVSVGLFPCAARGKPDSQGGLI